MINNIISKYKDNYGLEIPITEEMVLHHWNLERQLTKELLASNPDNRWEVFSRCYDRLYSELPWLNNPVQPDPISNHEWACLIADVPQRIYEVGSGQGGLIKYLAGIGHECTATEITHERGKRFDPDSGISWRISDGVHIDRFEPPESYDTVISDNVIEHLHPNDFITHLRAVRSILAPRGRYIFRTPHAFMGPSDVSRIFGCDRPHGMHLKEYTYTEVRFALQSAGYSKACAVWNLPPQIKYRIDPIKSNMYLSYLCRLEKPIAWLPQKYRRRVMILLMAMLINPLIFIIAQK